jgi:hypothetical protein
MLVKKRVSLLITVPGLISPMTLDGSNELAGKAKCGLPRLFVNINFWTCLQYSFLPCPFFTDCRKNHERIHVFRYKSQAHSSYNGCLALNPCTNLPMSPPVKMIVIIFSLTKNVLESYPGLGTILAEEAYGSTL